MYNIQGKKGLAMFGFFATAIIFGLLHSRKDINMYLRRRYFDIVTQPRTNLQFQNYEELRKLRDIIHKRIDYIQNPKSCETRKRLLCQLHHCGYGCTVNVITMCLIIGYETNRTVIVFKDGVSEPPLRYVIKNLSPTCSGIKAGERKRIPDLQDNKEIELEYRIIGNTWLHNPLVPADLFEDIKRFHSEPYLWWTSVFSSYITKPIETRKDHMILRTGLSSFKRPIVGVQVRRTDKKKEASYFPLHQYMTNVDKWFKSRPNNIPRIYLATDEPTVLEEIKQKYPQYKVMYDAETISASNQPEDRGTDMDQFGIFRDVYLLAKCDYVVCTFSSNVCRLVYQLMNAERGNISHHTLTSLDGNWYFIGSTQNDSYGYGARMPKYPTDL